MEEKQTVYYDRKKIFRIIVLVIGLFIWAVNCIIDPHDTIRHSAESNQLAGILGVIAAVVGMIEYIEQFIRNEYFYLDAEGIREKCEGKIWWEEIIEIREEEGYLKLIYKKQHQDEINYKAERGTVYMMHVYIYDFVQCIYSHVARPFRKFFEQDKNKEKEKKEENECKIYLGLLVKEDRQKVREMIWEYWERYR